MCSDLTEPTIYPNVVKEGKIQLQHILRAIGNMLIIVDCWGNFYTMKMSLSDKIPKIGTLLGTYDLTKSFEDQLPEVHAFLAQLLVKE